SSQIVAFVQHGLIVPNDGHGNTPISRLNFVQCNSELPNLFNASKSATLANVTGNTGGLGTADTQIAGTALNSNIATIQFLEGFANAWKTKNIAFLLANGTLNGPGGAVYTYNGATPVYPAVDLDQNVPGAIYNTESGFEYNSSATLPAPNP